MIFLDLDKGASSLPQTLWKEHFIMYELVDIMRQRDDLEFARLLNRLRLNDMTDDDKTMLQTRYVDHDTGDYPKDALFVENVFVNEHNDHVLNQMPVIKAVIPCHDTVVSANISAQRCQELIQSLPNEAI